MEEQIFAGAKISRPLWLKFAARAKEQDRSVAEALEDAIRAALNGKPLAQGRRQTTAAGKTNAR